MSRSVNIVTLGCSKNLVDSENLFGQLNAVGYKVSHDSELSAFDTVVINTCGFIGDAKEESVNTILQYLQLKKEGQVKQVFVTGCLIQRYKEDMQKELPEVDGFYGLAELPGLLESLQATSPFDYVSQRMITTPSHYAYVKIAEGCNHTCSYCAIPLIRGKYISRPIEEIVKEVEHLTHKGVKEIILIAQDLTFYGLDIYKERSIAKLVEALVPIEKLQWIRLQYAYPSGFPFNLLGVMKKYKKVCNYLDVSFQHINNRILNDMDRHFGREESYEFIRNLRRDLPDIVLRTSIIVGFPGETRKEFEELKQFVKDVRFERLGVFTYSHEEDTPAFKFKDSVSEKTKQARKEELMLLQQTISAELNTERIGQMYQVIIDRKEGEYYIGRTEFDSPEVDNEVLIKAAYLKVGEFYQVKITDANEFDLLAEII